MTPVLPARDQSRPHISSPPRDHDPLLTLTAILSVLDHLEQSTATARQVPHLSPLQTRVASALARFDPRFPTRPCDLAKLTGLRLELIGDTLARLQKRGVALKLAPAWYALAPGFRHHFLEPEFQRYGQLLGLIAPPVTPTPRRSSV